jgi:hypothetical protein
VLEVAAGVPAAKQVSWQYHCSACTSGYHDMVARVVLQGLQCSNLLMGQHQQCQLAVGGAQHSG